MLHICYHKYMPTVGTLQGTNKSHHWNGKLIFKLNLLTGYVSLEIHHE